MLLIVFLFIFMALMKLVSILIIAVSRKKTRYSEDRFDYEIGFVSMEEAVNYVLKKNRIYCRQDLDAWCGDQGRERFYEQVRNAGRIVWHMEDDPKKRIRAIYESLLPGYTNARVK
jgi:hypothetical protein